MLYIKLENEIRKNDNRLTFFYNKFYNLKYRLVKLREEKIENGDVVFLPNLEKYTYEKLSKYLKVKGITKVCISEVLNNDKVFREFLKDNNIEILDGRWLFRHMAFDVVEYICNLKKEKIVYQEVSILSNDIDRILKQIIFDLAKEVKLINLVTQNENKFKKIEKELYDDYGIILNINNNYQKSLLKSDIILNFDFEEDELNNYNINSKASIINFYNEIDIKEKMFSGINVNFFDVTIPIKYIRESIRFKEFNNAIFYESLIYKKTSPENILKQIKIDKININFLIGKNGIIRKNEYLKLSKKIAN